jgi:hypothetical protein
MGWQFYGLCAIVGLLGCVLTTLIQIQSRIEKLLARRIVSKIDANPCPLGLGGGACGEPA